MADFTNLNLEGANEKLNKALTDAKALKDSLLANHGGDASDILASVESKVSDLQNSFCRYDTRVTNNTKYKYAI